MLDMPSLRVKTKDRLPRIFRAQIVGARGSIHIQMLRIQSHLESEMLRILAIQIVQAARMAKTFQCTMSNLQRRRFPSRWWEVRD